MIDFNPKFYKLDDSEQVKVLSAIRGPDAEKDNALKPRFTTPIRCWLFNQSPARLYDKFGWAEGDPPPNTVEGWEALHSAAEAAVWGTSPASHYLRHVELALCAIQSVERVWGAKE